MPELLTLVAVPINVFAREHRSDVPGHDFKAGTVDRGKAGEKNSVNRFGTMGDIVGVELTQTPEVNGAPRCDGL